mmetsp:Transcript_23447/g.26606  ORF Transcript_23447/g.26606 Transcript_23447/m.26606 type:complete len:233 (+) Transcript_23447:1121-1819(+)
MLDTKGEVTITGRSGEFISSHILVSPNGPSSGGGILVFSVEGMDQSHVVGDTGSMIEVETVDAFQATVNTLSITGLASVVTIGNPHLDITDTHGFVERIFIGVRTHTETQLRSRQILLKEVIFGVLIKFTSSAMFMNIGGVVFGQGENLFTIHFTFNGLVFPAIKHPDRDLEHIGVDGSFQSISDSDIVFTSTSGIGTKHRLIFTEVTNKTLSQVTINIVEASPIFVVFVLY